MTNYHEKYKYFIQKQINNIHNWRVIIQVMCQLTRLKNVFFRIQSKTFEVLTLLPPHSASRKVGSLVQTYQGPITLSQITTSSNPIFHTIQTQTIIIALFIREPCKPWRRIIYKPKEYFQSKIVKRYMSNRFWLFITKHWFFAARKKPSMDWLYGLEIIRID